LAVRKQAAQKFDGEMRKLNGLEVRKHYEIKIINRVAVLGQLMLART
jgi:hypothetical protein